MMRRASLLRDTNAAAAAEMALVLPILLILLFGSVELGNFFLAEHVIDKAVRDAARYAGRLPITDYDCSVPSVDATALQQIQQVARFGDPTETYDTKARLRDWTDSGMTTVTLVCDTDVAHTYVNSGLYENFPEGVPVVTVRTRIPYTTFFGALGLGGPTIDLNATQQAAVFGA